MIDKVAALFARTARPNGLAMAVLAFLVVAIVLASAATAPYVFNGATLQGEIADQLREATGLRVVASDRASFGLLPTPHVELDDLDLKDADGALAVKAGALQGEVRLLPLIVGRLELSSATLQRPKLTIDLDADGLAPDSTIGRALRGLPASPGDGEARLGTVALVDGSATIVAKALPHPPRLDDIDVVLDWPDISSPATLTGSLTIDGVAADVAAWVAQPSTLMRGDSSPIALRVHATPLDLSANGDLTGGDATVFRGHMALSAPSLPALLARLGDPTHTPAPFANVSLRAETILSLDHNDKTDVDLQNLQLDLDGNRYEGALAYESGDKPTLSGTLATESLTLAPFLAAEPSLADAGHRWTRSALVSGGGGAVNLDLRLSATHLRVAPFTIDDAALSVMTRGERTEIAINDGKAYGGAVKAHASVGVSGGVVSLRGAGTLDDADLAGASWDALGRQVATGTLSGSLAIDTSGDSPAAMMSHLQGWLKGRARDGEISGLDLGRGLRAAAARPGALAAFGRGRTPFSTCTLALRVADGVATVETATLAGPDATARVTGIADIGDQRLALDASAAPPTGGRAIDLAIGGPFEAPIVALRPTTAPASGTR